MSAEQEEMAASLVLQRRIQGVVQTTEIIVSHIGSRAGGNADFWSRLNKLLLTDDGCGTALQRGLGS